MGLVLIATSAFGLGGLGTGVALVMRQWRLRKRDHEDHLLGMRIIELDPRAEVMAHVVKMRKAERPKFKPNRP